MLKIETGYFFGTKIKLGCVCTYWFLSTILLSNDFIISEMFPWDKSESYY